MNSVFVYIIQPILGCYIAYSFIAFLVFTTMMRVCDSYYFFPTHIYKDTDMNWFGCILKSLVYIICNPAFCVISTIVYIFSLIFALAYFITHVGYKVIQAEVVGMMLQDVQIGIETTGTNKKPRVIFDMKFDLPSGDGYRYNCTQQIFKTKEEAERL